MTKIYIYGRWDIYIRAQITIVNYIAGCMNLKEKMEKIQNKKKTLNEMAKFFLLEHFSSLYSRESTWNWLFICAKNKK